ncbi:MAG: sulfite exporter TauE/SafE family protein [Saprospiraceae bacterium]|nr:sulfite exporter TauE/SafE family protein [Saprospiraceae bacterium]
MFYAALLLGLAGSFHCIVMCGPLTLALPLSTAERWRLLIPLLEYHIGRVLTYMFLGLMLGILGQSIIKASWQQAISILAGVGMIIAAASSVQSDNWRIFKPFTLIGLFAKQHLGNALRSQSLFVAGLLNGLLPCGVVYMALRASVAADAAWKSAAFMMLFGLGTMPALLAIGLLNQKLGTVTRQYIRRLQPVVLALVGIMLIHRGVSSSLPDLYESMPILKVTCH